MEAPCAGNGFRRIARLGQLRSAGLLGIYVDWGGEDFGARFDVNFLSTDLDPLEIQGQELEADGYGTAFYLDLRWAFD